MPQTAQILNKRDLASLVSITRRLLEITDFMPNGTKPKPKRRAKRATRATKKPYKKIPITPIPPRVQRQEV